MWWPPSPSCSPWPGLPWPTRGHKRKPVTARQLHAYVHRYVRHHRGPKGIKGAAGTRGPQGAAGANGTGLVRTVASDPTHLGAMDSKIAEADCPAGQVATGGGSIAGDLDPATKGVTPDEKVFVFAQTGVGTGYVAEAENTGNGMAGNANATVVAFAICSPGKVGVTGESVVRALGRGTMR